MINLKEAIQRLAGTWGKANFKTFDATVVSVDVAKRTCIVNSLDSSILGLTVRFMLEVSDGDMSVPLEESTVSVAMTDFTEPYIVRSTWLKDKLFVVGDQSYEIIDGKQTFNDGAYGGIPIVSDPENANIGLLKKYNNLEKKINDLITAINGWSAVPNDGGAALKIALTSWLLESMTLTSESEISNPNIIHGKKF